MQKHLLNAFGVAAHGVMHVSRWYFLQKQVVQQCNMLGRLTIVTQVVDTKMCST